MLKTAQSTKHPARAPNEEREGLLLFSSLLVQNPFSMQNTTHLVDASSAWKVLNSEFLHLGSFLYATGGCASRKHSWLSPTPAVRLTPSQIPLQQQHCCGEINRAPYSLSSTHMHWETTTKLRRMGCTDCNHLK